MTRIPSPDHSIAALIDKSHQNKTEDPRPHLGCSVLGHPCDRYIWLSFRWAVRPQFSGRTLRIFRRGRNEELTVVSDLRAIGIDVRSTASSQAKVDLGCHVSGSVDGIIQSGVPESPKKKHVLEIKTHSAKSFADLLKNGVEKSKPMHFVQMQLYMHGMGIDRALYFAVCKDDDSIYTERVCYDKSVAEKYVDRGHRLALEDRMPPPISADPTWYQCKMCDAFDFCHQSKTTKEVNCRTCAHSTSKDNSTWRCERHQADGIPVDFQVTGCESHAIHPDLVAWPLKRFDKWTAIYEINSRDVANGEGCATTFTSREILANPSECANPRSLTQELRNTMGGRIVEISDDDIPF